MVIAVYSSPFLNSKAIPPLCVVAFQWARRPASVYRSSNAIQETSIVLAGGARAENPMPLLLRSMIRICPDWNSFFQEPEKETGMRGTNLGLNVFSGAGPLWVEAGALRRLKRFKTILLSASRLTFWPQLAGRRQRGGPRFRLSTQSRAGKQRAAGVVQYFPCPKRGPFDLRRPQDGSPALYQSADI